MREWPTCSGCLMNFAGPLVELVDQIQDAPRRPDTSVIHREFAVDQQRRFSRYVAEKIGFDFDRGRLDETSHPFCTTLGPQDCRILTRYDARCLSSGLFGTMHEAGHGMYEQGLPAAWFGLPPGSYVSLGIHESQSRLWENQVGRSRAFWQWLYPEAQQTFAPQLDDVDFGYVPLCGQRRPAELDPRGSGRGDLQPAHHHPFRSGAAIDRRDVVGRRSSRRLERSIRKRSGRPTAVRRDRRAAGCALERGADRLFSDLHPG